MEGKSFTFPGVWTSKLISKQNLLLGLRTSLSLSDAFLAQKKTQLALSRCNIGLQRCFVHAYLCKMLLSLMKNLYVQKKKNIKLGRSYGCSLHPARLLVVIVLCFVLLLQMKPVHFGVKFWMYWLFVLLRCLNMAWKSGILLEYGCSRGLTRKKIQRIQSNWEYLGGSASGTFLFVLWNLSICFWYIAVCT
jgi:hypothetical protein